MDEFGRGAGTGRSRETSEWAKMIGAWVTQNWCCNQVASTLSFNVMAAKFHISLLNFFHFPFWLNFLSLQIFSLAAEMKVKTTVYRYMALLEDISEKYVNAPFRMISRFCFYAYKSRRDNILFPKRQRWIFDDYRFCNVVYTFKLELPMKVGTVSSLLRGLYNSWQGKTHRVYLRVVQVMVNMISFHNQRP